MNIDNRLQLLQQQKLVLTPELKQAIAVLQLPVLELENFLVQQLQENPVLEMDNVEKEEVSLEEAEGQDNTEEWLEYFNDRSDLGINKSSSKEHIHVEKPIVSLPELKEFLCEQARLVFNSHDLKSAFYIIENIDANGYLCLNDKEAVENLGIPFERYAELLKRIQEFEPAGVGARNLSECLALQVAQKGFLIEDEIILLDLIKEHLQDVAEGKVTRLAQRFSVTPQVMQGYFDIVKKLNPHPGASYGATDNVYILPDITVKKISGEFIIIVNDAALPRITMSETYLNILSNEKNDEVRRYIQQKIHAASWLLRSIEQRRLTLYKVANAIIEFQNNFFEYGKKHLKPLILKQVAESIGMHESTISRAVANKYVQTPHGVFPLKFFFTGGLTTSSGQDTSVGSIKERIRTLIADEDTQNPLSDQKIVDIVTSEGVNISRRTVAKYREEMRILSSAKRKRY